MSFKWNTWLGYQLRTVFQYTEGLSVYEKAVFLNLLSRADKDGKCFPGKKRITRETGISMSQVKRALNSLEEKGFIKRTIRKKGGGGSPEEEYDTNLYDVFLNRIEAFSKGHGNKKKNRENAAAKMHSHQESEKGEDITSGNKEEKQWAVSMLTKWGIDRAKAEKIVEGYPLERVLGLIRLTMNRKPDSPVSYFLRGLEEHWVLPKDKPEV